MSDNEQPEVEVHNHFKEKDPVVVELAQSEDFQEFIAMLEAQAEAGESLANIIAAAVMTLFGPGFVLIGSPDMDEDEEGVMMPSEVGVCMSASNDLTPISLAHLLKKLSDAILKDVEESLESLKDNNDND